MDYNGQKLPKMSTLGSPNGQNDPRNTNSKYTDQECPKIPHKWFKNERGLKSDEKQWFQKSNFEPFLKVDF